MIFGLSGKPVTGTPYDREINLVAVAHAFPPPFLAAIAKRESNFDPLVVSGDDGHGLCQLTSSWPDDWADPVANLAYAIVNFLQPAMHYWHGLYQYSGDDLVRLVAATFNEGLGAAITYHARGDVDAGTTNRYGAGVLELYKGYCR